ncbi:hypothetical protein Hamer_G026762, partial [Homarus americanus]
GMFSTWNSGTGGDREETDQNYGHYVRRRNRRNFGGKPREYKFVSVGRVTSLSSPQLLPPSPQLPPSHRLSYLPLITSVTSLLSPQLPPSHRLSYLPLITASSTLGEQAKDHINRGAETLVWITGNKTSRFTHALSSGYSIPGGVKGSMESTRSKTEVWLIGQHITEITGAQLPSRGDVLRLFFHGHNEHKKTVNDSASEVAASVISFWNKARIPTITEKSIGRKVVDLFLMWKGLKKNCTRTTDTQRKKEETFCDELEDLFDVAHPKAMQLLTIKEDRAFLAAQREKGRRGVMAGVDKKIACSIKRREESKSKQSLQQNQASSALEYDELGSSSETESQSSSSSSTSSLAISPVVSSSNRKRATLKVITPELSSTLDRTGISHRSALRIVSATAASLEFSHVWGSVRSCSECHLDLDENRRSKQPVFSYPYSKFRVALYYKWRREWDEEPERGIAYENKMIPQFGTLEVYQASWVEYSPVSEWISFSWRKRSQTSGEESYIPLIGRCSHSRCTTVLVQP